MKTSLLLVLALLSCRGIAPYKTKVIGGEDVRNDEYPAVVAVVQPSGLPCTGSVIGKNTILTAAHCTLHEPITVFGRPATLLIRGDESGQAGERDLAILRYQGDSESDPQPIPLATTEPPFGAPVVIVGFGHGFPDHSDPLGAKRIGRNHLSDISELLLITGRYDDANGGDHATSASGDSGGPLLVNGQLLGVATGVSIASNDSRQSWYVNILSETSQNLLHSAELLGATITRGLK